MNKNKLFLKKTISWRIISTLSTLSIAYAITGSIKESGAITVVEFFVKMLFYYVHEKGWYKHAKRKKIERRSKTRFSKAYKRIVSRSEKLNRKEAEASANH